MAFSSKRDQLAKIIFDADTPAGKLYDIGLILAIIRKSKRLLLVWPALPLLKH